MRSRPSLGLRRLAIEPLPKPRTTAYNTMKIVASVKRYRDGRICPCEGGATVVFLPDVWRAAHLPRPFRGGGRCRLPPRELPPVRRCTGAGGTARRGPGYRRGCSVVYGWWYAWATAQVSP